MLPTEFIKTLYLGDRACKSLTINGWEERVVLQVDTISRVRSESGNWEFYQDEDIEDGLIVFTNATSVKLSPAGLIPNDLINSIEVFPINGEGSVPSYIFCISIGSVDANGYTKEVVIEVIAAGIHLESPENPGVAITD